jgi:hypothetical protein
MDNRRTVIFRIFDGPPSLTLALIKEYVDYGEKKLPFISVLEKKPDGNIETVPVKESSNLFLDIFTEFLAKTFKEANQGKKPTLTLLK